VPPCYIPARPRLQGSPTNPQRHARVSRCTRVTRARRLTTENSQNICTRIFRVLSHMPVVDTSHQRTSAPYMQHPPHTKHNHHHQLVTPRQCRHNVLREDKDRGRAQHTRERALLCRFFFCRFFSWTACEWLRQGHLHRLLLCPCPVLHLMTRPIETGRERARTLDASRNGYGNREE
jgi:hypothetical protein